MVGGVRHYRRPYHQEDMKVLPAPDCRHCCVYHWSVSTQPAINHTQAARASLPTVAWQNWVVAIFTLVVVTVLNHFAEGFLKLASILWVRLQASIFSMFSRHGKLWKRG